MGADGRAKVADLGLALTHNAFDVARIASKEQRQRAQQAVDLTMGGDGGGTPPYMAPRIIAEYVAQFGHRARLVSTRQGTHARRRRQACRRP